MQITRFYVDGDYYSKILFVILTPIEMDLMIVNVVMYVLSIVCVTDVHY